MRIEINPNDMTLGEMETIEELSGSKLSALVEDGEYNIKVLRAFIFVMERRNNPNYDYAETASIKFSDFEITADDEGKA